MPHRCFHHPPVLILSSAKPIEPKKCPVNHAFSMPVRYCICSNLRLRSNLSIVVPISCHFSEYKNQPLNYFFFLFASSPFWNRCGKNLSQNGVLAQDVAGMTQFGGNGAALRSVRIVSHFYACPPFIYSIARKERLVVTQACRKENATHTRRRSSSRLKNQAGTTEHRSFSTQGQTTLVAHGHMI